MKAGETQRFDFRLTSPPSSPSTPTASGARASTTVTRRSTTIQATGANVVNVHHATPINPWINYPFLATAR